VLEVPVDATPSKIKDVYRKLAHIFHPDYNPGDRAAEEKLKQINASYEILADTDKRRAYDAIRQGHNS
jgi:DnaJ-class molecular chaperone